MTAQGLLGIFRGETSKDRDAAFFAMERHDGCRKGGKGYPCRAIRTIDYLYIHNFEPTRWPAGSPDASVCGRSIHDAVQRQVDVVEAIHRADAHDNPNGVPVPHA